MFFGSDGLGLQFHNAKVAQFIGMVALSVILFSGGMDTKFKEIRPILSPGIVLSTVGVFLTGSFHRFVHLVSFRNGLDKYPFPADYFPTACIDHVVHRFCLRVRYPPFTEDESET